MKTEAIHTLATLRHRWQALPQDPILRRGFLLAAAPALQFIENTMPEHERWTSLPDQLTGRSTLGDHVATTRTLMGLLP